MPTSRVPHGAVAILALHLGFGGQAAAAESPGPSPAEVRQALALALDQPEALRATRLLVECQRDGRLPAVWIFGRGFGFWDGRRQFALAPATIVATLVAVRDGGFAELLPNYGGGTPPAEATAPADGAARKVVCRVRLELGEVAKEVVQLDEGEQSPALRRVADAIYGLCEQPARTGVEAESLEDGLEKLATGALEPEALSLALHRKPELQAAARRGGFLFRLEGRSAATQAFAADSGYGPTTTLELPASELAALARELARLRPSRLPENLWAPDYNDFSIAVLDRSISLQARSFTGMTATTHGERQREFDAAATQLTDLHERVLREGRPEPGE